MATRATTSMLAASLLGLLIAIPVQGRVSDRQTTQLTFRSAVGLPRTTLVPGTYIFERASAGTPDVVVVRSLDRRRVHFVATTMPSYRPATMRPEDVVTFGEAGRGQAPPIIGWYPAGEAMGYAFVY
jgi:hypothetical protein